MNYKELINIVKEAIKGNTKDVPKLKEKRGVFITLYKDGVLRGCIGYPYPTLPLGKALVNAAISAAYNDPRFPPLKKEELKDIKVEISILTEPKLVKDPLKEIKIGKDGIIIEKGIHTGLLLPQVAKEYEWDVKTVLEQTCWKAGLEKDCWKNSKVYRFQAKIIKE